MSKPSIPTKAEDFKTRTLNFGDRNQILDETNFIDAQGRMHVKSGTLRFLTIKLGVIEPKLSDEQINKLPERLANALYRKIAKESQVPLEP